MKGSGEMNGKTFGVAMGLGMAAGVALGVAVAPKKRLRGPTGKLVKAIGSVVKDVSTMIG